MIAIGAIWNKIKANEKLHMAWCIVGVVGSLMLYGVLQERIMVEPYGHEGDRFKYSLFLVLCNRLTSCFVAVVSLIRNGKMSEIKPVAPIYTYAAVSLSNVVATTCQYEALKYVSFPVQTLGKCAKMIPVMIWGILILAKRYGLKDFGLAILVTAGCSLFLMTGEVKSKVSAAFVGSGLNMNSCCLGAFWNPGKQTVCLAVLVTAGCSLFLMTGEVKTKDMWNSSIYGLLLMLGYLGFDGFTSTFQDRLFKGYQMTTYNQILYTTLCSSLLSLFGLVSSGQMLRAIDFIILHPEALWNIIHLSLSATVGALFISYTIKTFGSLIFATIMTTRQFLSILLSCLLFAHPLSFGQWCGTIIVFGALYYQSFTKSDNKHAVKDMGKLPGSSPKPVDLEASKPLLNESRKEELSLLAEEEEKKKEMGLASRFYQSR